MARAFNLEMKHTKPEYFRWMKIIIISTFTLFIVFQFIAPLYAQTWNDVSKLNPETVKAVVKVNDENDVVTALKVLPPGNHIVISGTRHSQGGHIVFPNATVLDMSGFNKVVSISPQNKTIVVQSGATWADLQEVANKHGLSVKVMQSSNIFSVGGSLSANAHGRDPRYGPIIETVNYLKIALHNGDVVITSRDSYADLFYAAIGGYGLLGVILEVELELTDNLPLKKVTTQVSVSKYPEIFANNLDGTALHYGRCSFVKNQTFLEECFSTSFYESESSNVVSTLTPEKNIRRNALVFNASRSSNLGKSIRWKLQKMLLDDPGEQVLVDRNNAMRPPIKFLDYDSSEDTDILQEYFVPLAHFSKFFEGLKNELIKSDVNLLSVTLRYLGRNEESLLSYSTEKMIAVVLYINIQLNSESIAKAQVWTRNLVDLAQNNKGTYYLTYQRFPTLKQFQKSYPRWAEFKKVKCKYDPNEVFTNKFYDQYFRGKVNKDSQALGQRKASGCL